MIVDRTRWARQEKITERTMVKGVRVIGGDLTRENKE